MPKLPALQDFQFFDTARITELHEKQCAYDIYMHLAVGELQPFLPSHKRIILLNRFIKRSTHSRVARH